MSHLSDDDLRDLLGMSPKPKKERLFDLGRCTCGGRVSSQGICYRCQTDHSAAMKIQAQKSCKQIKSQLSAEEFRAKLACLRGTSCHSCFHGQLDEHGNCDFCEYRYTDYHNII